MTTHSLHHEIFVGDCLKIMTAMPTGCVDLCFCSPPYEDARTYGIGFGHRGGDWVSWARRRFAECYRVTRGLVAWVVEGKTRKYEWSATPAMLMADLARSGIKLRKPPAFYRVGIPGSGGPDFLRNDYEFIICAAHGRLPWSDNTAMGHAPRWAPGGEMSHRLTDGTRRNQWGHGVHPVKARRKDGSRDLRRRPGHEFSTPGEFKVQTRRKPDGSRPRDGLYRVPKKANPGNVIECLVGGGVMGSRLCHENEAPFPESLAEFFIRSFCLPGGIVLDPFGGSGTVTAVAEKNGRNSIYIDIRKSQADICLRRLAEIDDDKSQQPKGSSRVPKRAKSEPVERPCASVA